MIRVTLGLNGIKSVGFAPGGATFCARILRIPSPAARVDQNRYKANAQSKPADCRSNESPWRSSAPNETCEKSTSASSAGPISASLCLFRPLKWRIGRTRTRTRTDGRTDSLGGRATLAALPTLLRREKFPRWTSDLASSVRSSW